MRHLTEAGDIAASADAVWQYMGWRQIKNLVGASFVEDCEFLNDVQGAGSMRRLMLKDGYSVIERCDKIDEAAMTYDYSLPELGDLPARDYRGRVTILPLSSARCRLQFECFYIPLDPDNDPWPDIYPKFQQGLIDFIRSKVERQI